VAYRSRFRFALGRRVSEVSRDLDHSNSGLDKESNRYRAPLTPGLVAVLKDRAIQWEAEMPLARIPFQLKRKGNSKL